ncbi:MAG: repair protein RecO [Clostridium sp.]|nr:repair protein RecO [Clostridium sp.]
MWIFTEKFGKITVIAKGAKKSKSKFMPISLIFCFGNYTLFKGKSMFNVNEGEIIDSFQQFLSDLDTLTYASYLCELIDLSMVEGESNRTLFREFVTAFYLIKNKVGDIETLTRAFEIKLLALTGYTLNLDYCVKCRKKIDTSNYFSYQYYGGICNQCDKSNGKTISFAAFKTLSYLSKLSLDKVYRVNLDSKIKDEVYNILSDLILQSYGKKPKSLEILDSLKRSD